jgi:ATP-binding cassette subfamily B protein
LLVDLACAVVVAGIALILPLCARHITLNVLAAGAPDALAQIYTTGVVMLGLVAVQVACNTFVDYQGHMMGTLIERDIRGALFAHYLKLPFSFYDGQKTGQLMSRLTNDLFAISELYHHGPEEALIAALQFGGAFVILLTINAGLTLIIFVSVPIMAAYALYFNRWMNTALRRSRERIGDINAQTEDTLAGIRVVQSFANEAIERQKFARQNQRFVESRREGYKGEAYFHEGMVTFTHLLTIGVIIFGGAAIVNASLNLADLLTYLLFIAMLIDPIHKFVNLARLYQEGITGFSRFMEMMAITPDIQDAPDAVELSQVRGDIRFDQVSFRYAEDNTHVLRRISLDIRAGEYVALVGTSGVGKTTLCSLIPRFYDVTEGAILIDGQDIRAVRIESLRRHIGVVAQDVYLFAGTVIDNIRYGRPEASTEEIIRAAKLANAHDFIVALPNGYDTDIGQRGIKLSGGQKQRLSIARVFLKNPPILIFDEATSALDNESERAVRESLERLAHNRTTLVIAHRLSTICNAQRIVVLTEAGIEAQGTHDELIRLEGTYASLYNGQLSM